MITEKILAFAQTQPNTLAYISDNEKITYKQLADESVLLAEKISACEEKRVIIYGDKQAYVVCSIVACLLCNKPYTVCSKATPALRKKSIVNILEPCVVVGDENIFGCSFVDVNNLTGIQGNIKHSSNTDAYIVFTSGTTGDPKGIVISNKNLENFIEWINKTIPRYENQVVVNTASFSFDLSVCDLYFSFVNGYTLYALNANDFSDFNKLYNKLNKSNADTIVCTPSFIKMCLCDKSFSKELMPNLKTVFFCGETLEAKTVQSLDMVFDNLLLINAYGPSECTCAVCADIVKDGKIAVGDLERSACNVFIEDEKIVIQGDSVGRYYNMPEFKNNCYNTGDIGKIEGTKLYFLGRADNQVKHGGYRIELEDIESNIMKIDGVISCAVVYKNARIVAFVQASKQINIREEIKAFLPRYMIPNKIIYVNKMLYNSNMKCDRQALVREYL